MHRRAVIRGLVSAAALPLAMNGAQAWAQSPGRWLRLESQNFVVFSTADEGKGRDELVALERFNALLARLMPRKERSPLKLVVYVANSDRDFERTNPGMGKGIAGFYDSSIEQVRAVTSPDRAVERQRDMKRHIRAMDARVILFHEYAHHFVAANSRRSYPRWYNEGFAEFIGTADFTDQGILIGMFTANRAIWLASGDWLGIDKFLLGWNLTGEETSMFYAQSWLATHYLFQNPERAAGFDRYCVALQDGGDPIGSFESSFGISPQAFDKALRDYKRKSIQVRQMPEEKVDYASTIKTERLGVAADEILMPLSYLRAVPPKQYAAETVKRIRQEARKHEGDPFALSALALAELWYGDPVQARAHIDALVKIDANNPETQHLSGLCDLRAGYKAGDAGLVKRAQSAFAAAHRLDGSRAVSLFRYVECLLFIEKSVNEHMLDVLVTAYRIAPQIDALALVAAQALIQHQRWDEALFILRPLVVSVHGGRTSERASVYLEAARAKQQATFTLFAAADKMELDFE
jgi:hypothetical protein